MADDVLISAYACDPDNPSEPVAGWAFFIAALNISQPNQKVHLLTRKVLEERIRSNLPISREKDVELHLISLPKYFRFLEKPGVGVGARVAYIIWNHKSKKYLKKQTWARKLRVAHHVTLATEVLPAPISVLPGSVLRIWGPIGSSGNPRIFLLRPFQVRCLVGGFLQCARNIVAPHLGRIFARNIDLVLCQTLLTQKIFAGTPGKAIYFTNEIMDFDLSGIKSVIDANSRGRLRNFQANKVNIVVVGNRTPRKRIDLALSFIKKLPDGHKFSLTVIGSQGKKSTLSLNIKSNKNKMETNPNIVFTGKISRKDANCLMAKMDVMFHPSAREGASFAVGEAISLGLPIVCFTGTGAADLVSNVRNAGIVIEPNTKSLNTLSDIFIRASLLESNSSDCWNMLRIESFLKEIYTL
jgi:glycosyltransferase involved in cell wall biosynthesis